MDKACWTQKKSIGLSFFNLKKWIKLVALQKESWPKLVVFMQSAGLSLLDLGKESVPIHPPAEGAKKSAEYRCETGWEENQLKEEK